MEEARRQATRRLVSTFERPDAVRSTPSSSNASHPTESSRPIPNSDTEHEARAAPGHEPPVFNQEQNGEDSESSDIPEKEGGDEQNSTVEDEMTGVLILEILPKIVTVNRLVQLNTWGNISTPV